MVPVHETGDGLEMNSVVSFVTDSSSLNFSCMVETMRWSTILKIGRIFPQCLIKLKLEASSSRAFVELSETVSCADGC